MYLLFDNTSHLFLYPDSFFDKLHYIPDFLRKIFYMNFKKTFGKTIPLVITISLFIKLKINLSRKT